MNKLITICILSLLLACNHPHYKNPHVLIETGYGDIEVELYPDKAPKTVAAFLSYVDSGFYTNSSFYRVLKADEMPSTYNPGVIQGGIYQTNIKQHPNVPGIVHETTKQTGLLHTNGTISLARTTPGTANTEFFICIGDQPQFNYGNDPTGDNQGFAAFGTVVNGMNIVQQIQTQPSHGQSFDKEIKITRISKL